MKDEHRALHFQHDIFTLEGRVRGALRSDISMLRDALHAATRPTPRPNVVVDHLERVIEHHERLLAKMMDAPSSHDRARLGDDFDG